MRFPRLLIVRQKFPDRAIRDIPGEVRRQLSGSSFAARLKPGARVAIGVGSRGISNLSTIVRAAVDYWKETGMRPFIFPAMGSHGGATAEGQAAVLAHYGITEATMGCPVVSQLEVVALGRTSEGIPAFMDREAHSADGVMLVSRVKWHTDFEGKIESGVFKMMAIGVGKFAGAQRYHTFAHKIGMERVIRSVGRQVLASGKMLGGLAILEDANHDTAGLEAVGVDNLEHREEELLALVKSWAGRIPCDLDFIIVDQMGKNISGTGMDTKIVNRKVTGQYNPWPGAPVIKRIIVRDLHPMSYGNATGIGMADITTDRLVARIDWNATRVNVLTAGNPAGAHLPLHFPTDRECMEALAPSVGRPDVENEITIGWIRDTMQLDRLCLTENLRAEIDANPLLEITGGPIDMTFDDTGNLVSPLSSAAASGH